MNEDDDDYEPYDGLDDDCDHGDYEVDILIGRAECNRCSHTWYMTDKQMKQHFSFLAQYYGEEDAPKDDQP